MSFCGAVVFALSIEFLLPRGTAEKPSAIFPLKQGETPVAFAWEGDTFRAGDRAIPLKALGAGEAKDGAKFVWKTKTADGEDAILKGTLKTSAARYEIPSFASLAGRKLDGKVSVTP